MIKLLIGGSPCTHWSIAQKKNREIKAEGIGWELFLNYIIAKEKFKPDFFLYENNWSASKEIKAQIQEKLGYELMRINSCLVSAQNRDRFYVFNWKVEQPEDRGVLLKDILEIEKPYVTNGKSCEKTTITKPIRIGDLPNGKGEISGSQATRIYNIEGKSVNIVANGGGQGAKTGLYAISVDTKFDNESVYKVSNGIVTIKNRQYPIKLKDGYYIIRNLTPVECERLQTLPDGYTSSVSNTQRYKGLGNGWTAEIIIHILQGALRNIPKDEKIVVLSMYDGIGTGRYCLDKMGFTNVEYHAYEIDKYAIQIAMKNYPDIIQHGDAFQVRNENWKV